MVPDPSCDSRLRDLRQERRVSAVVLRWKDNRGFAGALPVSIDRRSRTRLRTENAGVTNGTLVTSCHSQLGYPALLRAQLYHRCITRTTMASPVYPTTHFVLAAQSSMFPEGVILDVPLHIVRNITPRPVKWLRYASWAILHLEGTISQNGQLLHDHDTIEDGVECFFIPGKHSPQL